MAIQALPLALAATGTLGQLLTKGKKQKPTTVTQEPLLTPEQIAARQELQRISREGVPEYAGPLGAYDLTELERMGATGLKGLLGREYVEPEQTRLAKAEMARVLGTDYYDPYAEKGAFAGFRTRALREAGEASERFKREMAVGGRLFSTATGRGLADIEARTGEALTGKLGELYDVYQQRRLGMIPTALETGMKERAMEEDITRGRVGMAYQYGGLERILEDAKIKAKYGEWLRGQETKLKATELLATKDVPWGAKQVTIPGGYEPSPWSDVFSTLTQVGLQQMFPAKTPTTGAWAGSTPANPLSLSQGQWW